MNNLIEVNDSNFENEILKSDKLCLVDFWAEWCRPCLMISPIIEKIAEEYERKLKVGKLNVEQNNQTTQQYGIRSIPCLLFFKDGKVMDQLVGALPEPVIRKWIDEWIKKEEEVK